MVRADEGHGRVELGVGGHVAVVAGAEVEDVGPGVEEDVRGLAGEGEGEGVVGEGLGPGLDAGVQVGGDGGRG